MGGIIKIALLLSLTLSSLFLHVGNGYAEKNEYTCRKIVDDCESSNNIEYGSCLGYLAGLSGWEIFLQVNMKNHRLFCFPKGVTMGKIKKIFLNYTMEHPEELDDGASLCFYKAISQAYPCQDDAASKEKP